MNLQKMEHLKLPWIADFDELFLCEIILCVFIF